MDDVRKVREAETSKYTNMKRLTVFEVKIGDIVKTMRLFKNGEYSPHWVDHEVILIYWDKTVTDFTDYYLEK